MTNVSAKTIRDTVEELCVKAIEILPRDVLSALQRAMEEESNPLSKDILGVILDNARLAAHEKIPICQDTGMTYVFVELGQDIAIEDGYLYDAISQGVARAYVRGFLRKSVVSDPLFDRKNTGDNTPPVIHTEIVPGDEVKITVMPKGTGSENMSAVRMLTPGDGIEGVRRFVMEVVEKSGPNACPPLIVGVGIGGMMDKAAYLAKKALLREIGSSNPDPRVAAFEKELVSAINGLGIGPGGLGGATTCLAVHIETYPTHIGALPVAVNLQCHAARRASAVIRSEKRVLL
ncbi:MAG: fumarate hydratase [Candidatus Fermentithermobacillus carboniphilus]|uniref:Fumarate hydratase n=1 Tax=Candidatus Fermentithermobacillus carboniphilus TaxID=3085328 RepID=A0AAT9LB53_9FIRM|nr:MAG: fumarate hydratase [Candidatus Fermentithermobacillus carboniphilus]